MSSPISRAYLFKFNDNGASPFHIACSNGYLDIIEFFMISLEGSSDFYPNKEAFDVMSAITLASCNNHNDVIKFLLKNDQINIDNKISLFSSYYVCGNGNLEAVKLLFEDGRFTFVAKWNGISPFHEACKKSHIDIINYLLKNCDEIVIPDEIFSDEVEVILMNYR